MPDCKAFTSEYDAISKKLINMVTISSEGKSITVKALWDTGATCSCVSHQVVSDLKLSVISIAKMLSASEEKETTVHYVDVFLPNGVSIPGVEVYDSEIGKQGIGMLVGMDIITRGDFSVSNANGKTVFTYRHPSQERIDFVRKIRTSNKIGDRHGRGKRKRKAIK